MVVPVSTPQHGAKSAFTTAAETLPEKMNVDAMALALIVQYPETAKLIDKAGTSGSWPDPSDWKDKPYAADLTRVLALKSPQRILENVSTVAQLPDKNMWFLYAARKDPEGALIVRENYTNFSKSDVSEQTRNAILTTAAARAPGRALDYVSQLDDLRKNHVAAEYNQMPDLVPYRDTLLRGALSADLAAAATADPMRMNDARPYWQHRPDAVAIRAATENPENLVRQAQDDPIMAIEHYPIYAHDRSGQEMLTAAMMTAQNGNFLPEIHASLIDDMNTMHEAPDAVRFAVVDSGQFNARNLYDLIQTGTQPNDEHSAAYTSTYNKLLDRMQAQMRADNVTLLDIAKDQDRADTLPSFLETAAGYGRVGGNSKPDADLLNYIPAAARGDLLVKTLRAAEDSQDPDEIAKVATLTAGIKDPATLKDFEKALIGDYDSAATVGKRTQLGLLASSYAASHPEAQNYPQIIGSIAANPDYALPDTQKLDASRLYDAAGRSIQVMTFNKYKDGTPETEADVSFNNMLSEYRRAQDRWKIEDKGSYVHISSRDKGPGASSDDAKVQIFANKPEFDGSQKGKNGLGDIERTLTQMSPPAEPDKTIFIQRGHSYYIDAMLPHISPDAPLVMLGSCGSATDIKKVLDRAPNAQLYSTRGNGFRAVNDPTMFHINDTMLRAGEPIDWAKTQDFMSRIKVPGVEEYVLPPDNAALSFAQAYNNFLKSHPDTPADTFKPIPPPLPPPDEVRPQTQAVPPAPALAGPA